MTDPFWLHKQKHYETGNGQPHPSSTKTHTHLKLTLWPLMTLSEEFDPFQKVNSSILDLHGSVTKAQSMFDMTSCLHSQHIHTDTVCKKTQTCEVFKQCTLRWKLRIKTVTPKYNGLPKKEGTAIVLLSKILEVWAHMCTQVSYLHYLTHRNPVFFPVLALSL